MHGQSERQMRFHKAAEMLRKAKTRGYPTILSRWEGEENYRSSLATERFREEDIWNFYQLALEKHDYIATRSERLRYSQQWVLSKNSDGKHLPRHLCPERAAAQRECQRLRDEFMANSKESYKPVHPSKQQRQNPYQQFEGSEEYDYAVDRRTGCKWLKEQVGDQPHTCILRPRRPHRGRT